MSFGALSDTVIIFDLDGTLVDSAPDLAGAMNHVLKMHGHETLPVEEVRHLVGNGAKALLQQGFAHNGVDLDNNDPELGKMIVQFVDWYQDHIADSSFVFPDCESVLSLLKSEDAALAVCTNKIEKLAQPLLEELSLTPYFEIILGRDSLPQHKPSPAPIIECLKRSNREKAIMIGDTMTDVNAAIAANIDCYFATFGYGTLEEKHSQSIRQFDTYYELPDLLNL